MNSKQSSKRQLSRRNFLKLGGAAAFSLLPTALPAFAAPAVKGSMAVVKVPVLVPEGVGAADFVRGLNQGADRIHWSVQTIKAGNGEVYQKAETLFKTGEKVIIAFLNPDTVPYLHPLLEKYGATLIAATAGENVVRPADYHPQVFYVSLHYRESNWVAGYQAAESLGKKAFVLSSFYESGYDALYAFSHGFEANGGQVIATRVTHVDPKNTHLEQALAAALHSNADLVFAAYERRLTPDFMRAWAVYGDRPLVTSAFMNVNRSTAVRSWLPSVAPMLAVGQDTARLVEQAFATGDLMTGLRTASFPGARSLAQETVFMNPVTRMLESPLYLKMSGKLITAGLPSSLAQLPTNLLAANSVKTGWITAYELI